MADNILRLKVDSQEYDAKIRRAAEGIQQYAQRCHEVGGTLQHLDDGVLEFVQALGSMNTVSTSTKQQLREMSNALTTLTQTYRGLTDEEKASPFGQELAHSIQQLTERAGAAQDAMMDVQASIRNAASDTRLFDQMAQGMSVATAGFQGLTGAGKLLGIEMGNDVEVIAKLQAAMAVTNSLTTIQNALQKQSALMQGLNAAKTSLAVVAQQAYAVAAFSPCKVGLYAQDGTLVWLAEKWKCQPGDGGTVLYFVGKSKATNHQTGEKKTITTTDILEWLRKQGQYVRYIADIYGDYYWDVSAKFE